MRRVYSSSSSSSSMLRDPFFFPTALAPLQQYIYPIPALSILSSIGNIREKRWTPDTRHHVLYRVPKQPQEKFPAVSADYPVIEAVLYCLPCGVLFYTSSSVCTLLCSSGKYPLWSTHPVECSVRTMYGTAQHSIDEIPWWWTVIASGLLALRCLWFLIDLK